MEQEVAHHLFWVQKIILSLLATGLILLARWAIVRQLEKQQGSGGSSVQRWINSIKNAAALLIAVSLVFIWLSELRFVALSVAAFVVALVIATREFIQCFLGAIYLASSRIFVIGDWIKVGGNCGEVIRSDWLSTVILEVDIDSGTYSYTGKTLVIPNNQFVASTVHNLNFMRRYVTHTFALVRDAENVNVCEARELVLEQARQCCEPFLEIATRYNQRIESKLGITLAGPEPDVRITTNSTAKSELVVTIFCPTEEAVNIEQKITDTFMAFWYAEKAKVKSPPAS